MTPPSPSRPKSPERRAAEGLGRRGEWFAALYLTLKGYRIRAMRVQTPVGELDLVAERFGTVAFVEVKSRTRRQSDFDPLLAVNRRRIVAAARHYVSRHPALTRRTLRFDVILLTPGAWPRHLVNAFDSA
ncbi:MAG TPA: YraN family protein [Alphaproteobacteria bacterium]|nr:YraN family protein [Alphaproteobacteria bacterium]